MDTEKKVIIGRPINGISINGLEYALDERGEVKEFADKKEAVQFLKDNGFRNKDLECFIYEEIEKSEKKPVKDHEPMRKSASKKKYHDRDDDRGR
jgi:hypothetical protein